MEQAAKPIFTGQGLGDAYLRHIGDEEGQPCTEEQSQEHSQCQTGLQRLLALPVSQTPFTIY